MHEGLLCWNFIGGLPPSRPSHTLLTHRLAFFPCLLSGPFESYTVTGCSGLLLPLPLALLGSPSLWDSSLFVKPDGMCGFVFVYS